MSASGVHTCGYMDYPVVLGQHLLTTSKCCVSRAVILSDRLAAENVFSHQSDAVVFRSL